MNIPQQRNEVRQIFGGIQRHKNQQQQHPVLGGQLRQQNVQHFGGFQLCHQLEELQQHEGLRLREERLLQVEPRRLEQQPQEQQRRKEQRRLHGMQSLHQAW